MRVLEDIVRFIIDDGKLTVGFKNIRHELTRCLKQTAVVKNLDTLQHRQVQKDVGKGSIPLEFQRKNVLDIFLANAQRAKESIRVLEEFFKILDKTTALQLKKLRYKIYSLEQRSVEKLMNIRKH
ncbi:MAG: thiamine-phosphate pyrophosphorylase [PVC group bacterium]|nr:thiamine-phosphate pyrophosphorylase [PVC group bacterium]